MALNINGMKDALEIKAICPACGNEFTINEGNVVRKHSVNGNSGFDCPGSYEPVERIAVNAEILHEILRRITS